MIMVSVLYPAGETTRFDMDYYCKSHMPLVQRKLGAACESMAVDHGLGSGTSGAPPAYTAMGHLYFESVEEFQAAFAPHAAEILADIPNYTNIQPVPRISEVKM
jgi:uncharacterized protein (TIGR02118 family)